MTHQVHVVHIINSFEFGGAEAMLCNLLLRADRRRFRLTVVSLIDDLTVAAPILAAGIPIKTIGMKPGVPDPRGVMRLARHLRELQPDVIQTWMDHSNLIGALAARIGCRAPVIWGVHHSDHVRGLTKRSTLLTVSACASLSRTLPARVIFCSEHSRKLYAQRGFSADKLQSIPNGINSDIFHPDADARRAIRLELGCDATTPLVGLIARYHPLKDHTTFLRAAAQIARAVPDARFVLCGDKVDPSNAALMSEIQALGIANRCHLLGPRRDVPRILASLDVAISSSISEAFPLVVGEAMASAVPCVVTNVGDSALIVGDTGRVTPRSDPSALATACRELLEMPADLRANLGISARQRVKELFDLDAVTRRYEAVYAQLALPRVRAATTLARSNSQRMPARIEWGDPSASTNGIINRRRPKRVLLLVESSAGGTGRHVLDLAEGLIARGCETHLLYSTGRVDSLFLQRLAVITGLRHKPLPLRTEIHPSDLAAVHVVHNYLQSHGPFDVIHGHSSKGGALARLAALGSGVPAFYTLHGLIMMDPGLARWKRFFYLAIERLLSLGTQRIIAVSPEEQRAAVRLGLGRSRVALIPNGIGPLELSPRAKARNVIGVPDNAFVIGFVGRLVDQKAPHILLQAFATAANVIPNAVLAMVGSGPLQDSLQLLARKLGIASKVLWLGERDARGVLAAFDLFAVSSRKEGLPYVVLEAMATALPIVATASAGIEILVEPNVNGAVVPTDDAPAFAAALIQIASDPAMLARFGQASRQRAAAFTVDAMVDETLLAYTASPSKARAPLARAERRRRSVTFVRPATKPAPPGTPSLGETLSILAAHATSRPA